MSDRSSPHVHPCSPRPCDPGVGRPDVYYGRRSGSERPARIFPGDGRLFRRYSVWRSSFICERQARRLASAEMGLRAAIRDAGRSGARGSLARPARPRRDLSKPVYTRRAPATVSRSGHCARELVEVRSLLDARVRCVDAGTCRVYGMARAIGRGACGYLRELGRRGHWGLGSVLQIAHLGTAAAHRRVSAQENPVGVLADVGSVRAARALVSLACSPPPVAHRVLRRQIRASTPAVSPGNRNPQSCADSRPRVQ